MESHLELGLHIQHTQRCQADAQTRWWSLGPKMEGGYKIACHNTSSPEGVLDNSEPAPPDLIRQLEKQTSIKAPEVTPKFCFTGERFCGYDCE